MQKLSISLPPNSRLQGISHQSIMRSASLTTVTHVTDVSVHWMLWSGCVANHSETFILVSLLLHGVSVCVSVHSAIPKLPACAATQTCLQNS